MINGDRRPFFGQSLFRAYAAAASSSSAKLVASGRDVMALIRRTWSSASSMRSASSRRSGS